MKIIKRDGREVLFNGSKIAKAVAKANAEVSKIHHSVHIAFLQF